MAGEQEVTPPSFQHLEFLCGEGPCCEAVPEMVHRLCGRMDHVRSVEAVVAEFVKDNLVGGEIVSPFREGGTDFIQGQEKDSLAQLVAMRPILEMADRGECEYELLPGEPGHHIL